MRAVCFCAIIDKLVQYLAFSTPTYLSFSFEKLILRCPKSNEILHLNTIHSAVIIHKKTGLVSSPPHLSNWKSLFPV